MVSCSCDKIAGNGTWEEEFILAHGLRVWPVMEKKSWQQEPEVASHLSSAAREQREMDAGV